MQLTPAQLDAHAEVQPLQRFSIWEFYSSTACQHLMFRLQARLCSRSVLQMLAVVSACSSPTKAAPRERARRNSDEA